ncbi:hypothetical protein P4O66_013940, partial [Electrophorus voltai]
MNENLWAPCTRKHKKHTARQCPAPTQSQAGQVPPTRETSLREGERQLPCLSRGSLECPWGDLPPRLWADPFSLAGESAEGKGLRRSCWLHATALFLILVVPLSPPRPRLHSLRPPQENPG